MTIFRRPSRPLLIVLGSLFLWLLAVPSQAQITVVESEPADSAVVDRPPRSIRIWFDQAPDPETSRLRVSGPDGGQLDVSGMHTMGEQDLMAMVSGHMPDGTYTISWETAGPDGETHSGTLGFTVARAATSGTSTKPDPDSYEAPLDIGIVLYDGAEPLDVFGPLEMWMNAGPDLIKVHLIAEEKRPIAITTTGYPPELSPQLMAQYSFADAPELDVIMVPGGIGTLREVENERMIEFLSGQKEKVTLMTSVCTGAALLAKAGVLDGEKATGNKAFFNFITEYGPQTDWQEEARWVESGNVFTSSGVSAGIDMSLAVIARFFGIEGARMVAAMTEYEWQEDPANDPFTGNLNLAMPGIESLKRTLGMTPTSTER